MGDRGPRVSGIRSVKNDGLDACLVELLPGR